MTKEQEELLKKRLLEEIEASAKQTREDLAGTTTSVDKF